jgi:hypothetical protein
MVGRRYPRRFNVMTKATIAKALTSYCHKPKYVGFRENPVSSVYEAAPPAYSWSPDDGDPMTVAVAHPSIESRPITMTHAMPPTPADRTIIAFNDTRSRDSLGGVVAALVVSPERTARARDLADQEAPDNNKLTTSEAREVAPLVLQGGRLVSLAPAVESVDESGDEDSAKSMRSDE